MKIQTQLAQQLSEKGMVPDNLVRRGIRNLLRQRLEDIHYRDVSKMGQLEREFILQMKSSPIALLPDKANEQHYEIPAAFFHTVLGQHLKYSCGYWESETQTLEQSEKLGLRKTCEHAGLKDGMDVLELGCGWGSLTLWMAHHYPNSYITAVSNSHSQGQFILQRANEMGLFNIDVITADMNDFHTDRKFDRVVSVEMFEHMRNWQKLYANISHWLKPDGKFFKHIFVHKACPYAYEDNDASDWMSRYFFSGGMMPSDSLPLFFQDHLQLEQRWRWDGRHYEKTSNAWLQRMDDNRSILWPLFEQVYGQDFASLWWNRWRLFFMACAELFGYEHGQQWWVSHYLFCNKSKAS